MNSSARTHLPSVERPWLKYYSDEAKRLVVAENTMYERLVNENKDRHERIAYDYLGGSASFGRMIDQVEQAASAFSALGVKKGDIVAYCSMSCPEVIISMYALNKLGAAVLLLDPRRSPDEIQSFIDSGNVHILLVTDIFFPNIQKILPEVKLDKVIVSRIGRSAGAAAKAVLAIRNRKLRIPYGENILSFDDFLALGRGISTEMARFDEFEVAAITLSGGTTGTPKGIMITNRMICTLVVDVRSGTFKSDSNCTISIAPVFSSYGLVCGTHVPLSYGHKVVILPKPEPDNFCKLFIKHRPGNITLVPGFYEKLIENRRMKGVDMSFLVNAVSGGDSMSLGLEDKTNAFLNEHNSGINHISQGYGMSEMCSAVTVCSGPAYKRGSVGIPMLHINVCICEPGTTEELGYNMAGEICTTGPSLMKGYLNNWEETRNVIKTHADGQKWYHSGDTGYIDEDGFLFFTGRIKLAIARPDGHKVFPVQLKNVASKVDNVADCCCVGVKDGINKEGMWPVVAVILKDKALKEQTLKAVAEALRHGVEERAQPMDIYAVDELPLIGMGKVDYNRVAEEYMKAHGIEY